jgi:putative FmdB family regulatory protein
MQPMPIYEYACTACGERVEARQGFDDPPLDLCPHCGGKLRKLYSPVGIVFKGSGFYSTDHKSAQKAARGDKADKADSSDKPAAKAKSDKPKPKKAETSDA